MATATILANAGDGFIQNVNYAGNWDIPRDSALGTVVTNYQSSNGISVYRDTGRGGGTYLFRRSFFYFNTAAVPGTVTAADLYIKRLSIGSNPGSRIMVVKSNAFGGDGLSALAAADNIDYPGYSAASSMSGAVTDYITSAFDYTAVASGDYAVISLNSTAFTDIATDDYWIIMVVNYDYDYLDTIPASSPTYIDNGLYYRDATGTSNDPKIVVTYTPPGYGHDVIGVTSTDIVEVNSVAAADIVSINDVT